MVKSKPYTKRPVGHMRRMKRNRKGPAKTVRIPVSYPPNTASKYFHTFLQDEGIDRRCTRDHKPDNRDAKPTRSCCGVVWKEMFNRVCSREWYNKTIGSGSKRDSLIFCCYGCAGKYPLERATLGHKKSAFNGGAFEIDNLCLTCEMCEIATGKSDLLFHGWRIYGHDVKVFKKFMEMKTTSKYMKRIKKNRELIAQMMRDFLR